MRPYANGDGLPSDRRRRLEIRLSGFGNIRVMRTPDQITAPNAVKAERAIPEGELQAAARAHADFINPPAFLRLTGIAPVRRVKDKPVPRFAGRQLVRWCRFDDYRLLEDIAHTPDQHPPVA